MLLGLIIGLPASRAQAPGADIQYVLVEGQITDGVGAGLGGVKVEARPAGKPDAEPVSTTETDPLGDFLLVASSQYTGKLEVSFKKKMFEDFSREVEVGAGKTPFLGATMKGNLSVRGRVINGLDESPVAGAKIQVTTFGQTWNATSGADGRFTFEGLAPGSGDVSVNAKGFGRETKHVENFADVRMLELSIKPERIVTLTVVDDDDKPVKGVAVEVYDAPRDDMRTFVTDENGKIVVPSVHFDAEMLALRMTRKGYVNDVDFTRVVPLPHDKTHSEHKEVIHRAGRVVGRIKDARTGEPLHGARIITGSSYTENSPRDWSDPHGHYAIEGVPPGPTVVTVHLEGHAPELREVTVTAGADVTADFELGPGQTVLGRVQDENGDPVNGMNVLADAWRGHTTLDLRAISGADGKFVLADAPTDTFQVTAVPKLGDPITHSVIGSSGKAPTFVFPVKPVGGGAPRGEEGLRIGDTAPTFTVTTLDGTKINTADYAGKVVLLDFWATWCAPCLDEMPHVVAVWEKYGSRDDFVLLGLSRDFQDVSCKNYLRANPKMTWPEAVGNAGGAERAVTLYGVTWIPRTYLIGKDGKVAGKNLRGEKLMDAVSKLLDGKKGP